MGPDGCHPRVLKEAADVLSEPLCLLMNKTFEEQSIQNVWKDANVSALLKNKGARTDQSNYRPVSLMCIPCKLCEKTVREVLMKHTIMILSFRTPKKFVVITLKFELCGFTIE